MKNRLLNLIIRRLDQRLQYSKDFSRGGSGGLFCETMLNYYKKVNSANEEGKPMAWAGLFAPIEILHAMDIVPFVIEYFTTMLISEIEKL